jgi:hypothetical protein
MYEEYVPVYAGNEQFLTLTEDRQTTTAELTNVSNLYYNITTQRAPNAEREDEVGGMGQRYLCCVRPKFQSQRRLNKNVACSPCHPIVFVIYNLTYLA